MNSLEYQQRRKYEIQGKLRDFIRQIKISQPQIGDQEAVQAAISIMTDENNEFTRLEQDLPVTVNQLNSFKAQARELVNDLRNL